MMRLRREDGLSLVEMLVAVAISSLVAAGMGTALHQFLTTSERTRVAQAALHDVQNTGHWLSIDGKKVTSTDLGDGAAATGEMTLTWTVGAQAHNARYYLDVDDTELRRSHNGTLITVARYVTDANFSLSGRLITVNLTTSPPGRWESSKDASFKIWVRPGN